MEMHNQRKKKFLMLLFNSLLISPHLQPAVKMKIPQQMKRQRKLQSSRRKRKKSRIISQRRSQWLLKRKEKLPKKEKEVAEVEEAEEVEVVEEVEVNLMEKVVIEEIRHRDLTLPNQKLMMNLKISLKLEVTKIKGEEEIVEEVQEEDIEETEEMEAAEVVVDLEEEIEDLVVEEEKDLKITTPNILRNQSRTPKLMNERQTISYSCFK